jgi:hypothetical protein
MLWRRWLDPIAHKLSNLSFKLIFLLEVQIQTLDSPPSSTPTKIYSGTALQRDFPIAFTRLPLSH